MNRDAGGPPLDALLLYRYNFVYYTASFSIDEVALVYLYILLLSKNTVVKIIISTSPCVFFRSFVFSGFPF